jgi:hypothetical protein
MRGRSASAITPGSPEDRTETGFCIRKGISKSTFHRMMNAGRGPRVTAYGPRTLRITKKDEADWDRSRANPGSTEQRLLAKMEAKRTAKAKKAAAASLAGPNHVSKKRKKRPTV